MLDGQGLAVSVENDTAVLAYNKAVTEWLDYKISSMRTLKQAIELEPDFCIAHCFRGYLLVTFNSAAVLPAAVAGDVRRCRRGFPVAHRHHFLQRHREADPGRE